MTLKPVRSAPHPISIARPNLGNLEDLVVKYSHSGPHDNGVVADEVPSLIYGQVPRGKNNGEEFG